MGRERGTFQQGISINALADLDALAHESRQVEWILPGVRLAAQRDVGSDRTFAPKVVNRSRRMSAGGEEERFDMGAIEPFTRKQSFSTTAVHHFALRARISLCASGVDLFRSQTQESLLNQAGRQTQPRWELGISPHIQHDDNIRRHRHRCKVECLRLWFQLGSKLAKEAKEAELTPSLTGHNCGACDCIKTIQSALSSPRKCCC